MNEMSMSPATSDAGLDGECSSLGAGGGGGGGVIGGGGGVIAAGGGENPQSHEMEFVVDEFVPFMKGKTPAADVCPHAQPPAACADAALVTNGTRPVGARVVPGGGVGEGGAVVGCDDAALTSSRAELVDARYMLVCASGGDDDDAASMPAVEDEDEVATASCVVVA